MFSPQRKTAVLSAEEKLGKNIQLKLKGIAGLAAILPAYFEPARSLRRGKLSSPRRKNLVAET